MRNDKISYAENLLLSAAGHLAAAALLATSFAALNPMNQVVMSDHVQILEIDLSRVKITGDETLVFNTDVPAAEPAQEKIPEPKEKPKQKENQAPKEKPKPKEDLKPKEEPKPELFGDEKPEEFELPVIADAPPKPELKPDKPAAPKAPTVVRVNRETASLNRTMTVSVVDALRVAMTRCWVFDRNYPGLEEIRAVAHLAMNRRGFVQSMWFEQESAAAENPPLAYIFETIRAAIDSCQPFGMLPESEYENWKSIQLTFYPSSGTVH